MYIDDLCKVEPNLRVLYEVALDFFLLTVGQYPTGNFSVKRKGVNIYRTVSDVGLEEGVLFPNGSSVLCRQTPENTRIYVNDKEISYSC